MIITVNTILIKMAICGPKLSMCCLLLSVWGIVMLALLGVFLRVHSPAFIEDLPINEEEWAKINYDEKYVYDKYNQASTNCFIAAGLYGGVFVLSFVMWRINSKNDYTTA